MNITYQVLTGVDMPEFVARSNNWRKLREALNGAATNEPVVIYLSRADYPTDEDMRKATETSRGGAYAFGDGAELSKRGLTIRTTAAWIKDLPSKSQQKLDSSYGITNPDDRVLICRKVRLDT